jgi:hypothetical protein
MTAEIYVPAFFVKQKFCVTTTRCDLFVANPDEG